MLMTEEREAVDVGWYDEDDGTFIQKNDLVLDDGGYYLGWGIVKEEIIEEVHVDQQQSFDESSKRQFEDQTDQSYMESKEDDLTTQEQHQDYTAQEQQDTSAQEQQDYTAPEEQQQSPVVEPLEEEVKHEELKVE